MGFVRRFAFWFGVGMFALYTHGKLRFGSEPAVADRAGPAPLAALEPAAVVGGIGSICVRHPDRCVAASQAITALIDRLDAPAPPGRHR